MIHASILAHFSIPILLNAQNDNLAARNAIHGTLSVVYPSLYKYICYKFLVFTLLYTSM